MNESDYIEQLQTMRSGQPKVSTEMLSLIETALISCPQSTKLWCIRGDLIQLSDLDAGYTLNDVLESYKQAAASDPDCAEAYESIGYYYDAVMNDPHMAQPAFRKALSLNAGVDTYFGLARVLAELNHADGALNLIAPDNCPYCDDPKIKELAEEIRSGTWSTEDDQ
ncbi:MAG: hypothetical protein M1434_07770 [Chloroflexi bacterium]|nr:hypothetical protein [Chloroflexota bacterium]